MTMKPLVYIAGPFRSLADPYNYWEQEQNIRKAETLALEVWKLNAVAICPHAMSRFYQGALVDEVWLQGDLEILSRCDAVLLVPGWERSIGARTEHAFAFRRTIPVFATLDALEGWLEETYETDRNHPALVG